MSAADPGAATPPVFESSYAELPADFHARVGPTPVARPRLLRLNRPLALELGLSPDWLASAEGVEMLAGNRLPEGARPVAMAYAGHQFGHWVPSLGDGRAVLLGEVVDREGVRRDVQLKGSGPTPFSRRGDGRAALGPVLREYLLCEAMAGLGIPSTRALAMVETGEPVLRERPLRGAVLTRVARAHVRVGTFQYFHAREQPEAVRRLADYVIERDFSELGSEAGAAGNPYRALLDAAIERQADLISRWMAVGFIHGVMNTDNMSVVGETIDYGPCAFMDAYHPSTVYSSIDHAGRYAFDQQPRIAHWNLARFAETLLPLLAEEEEAALESAREALDAFPQSFARHYHGRLRRKLGLAEDREGDLELVDALLRCMAEQGADFSNAFRALSELDAGDPGSEARLHGLFAEPASLDAWLRRWRERLAAEGRDEAERRREMRAVNPAFIPRNHRVQQAIEAAEEEDLAPLDELLRVTARPYDDHPGLEHLARPPEAHEVVHQTFCGT